MNKHHTKAKGDLAVFKAQLDLHVQGFWVATPLTENAPFDLIINRNGVSQTVQVKHAKLVEGVVHIPLRSSWADKHGTHNIPVDKTLVDLYCAYCPETDQCYYCKPGEFANINQISLRLEPTKNRQSKGVIWAHHYKLAPVA